VLQIHDHVPMFTVRNQVGNVVLDYRDLWQRKQLVLVSLTEDDVTRSPYVESLLAHAPALGYADTALVVTGDSIEGVPRPGLVVVDRWGEVRVVASGERAADLPRASVLAEWVFFIGMGPECQGESG
jgi:hypothetical protein